MCVCVCGVCVCVYLCLCVCGVCVCEPVCVCAVARARVPCMYVSLASDYSETVKVTIVKLGVRQLTASVTDMRMHHVLIILTLTLFQGQTDRNHENNKSVIIS